MKFTEVSQTQPGQAYTASDLIRRSLNGTMPAIYKEGTYEAEEGLTYEKQEQDDFFLDSEPQLEDLSELKDFLNSTNDSVANAVAKARESHLQSKSLTQATENPGVKPAEQATPTLERKPATSYTGVHS